MTDLSASELCATSPVKLQTIIVSYSSLLRVLALVCALQKAHWIHEVHVPSLLSGDLLLYRISTVFQSSPVGIPSNCFFFHFSIPVLSPGCLNPTSSWVSFLWYEELEKDGANFYCLLQLFAVAVNLARV